jgi:outer membrane protein
VSGSPGPSPACPKQEKRAFTGCTRAIRRYDGADQTSGGVFLGVELGPRSRVLAASCLLSCALVAAGVPGALAAESASYGPVRADETLWSVARRVNAELRAGTTAQVAWALYRANPQAFDGAPTRLRAGVTLSVPAAEAVRTTPHREAYAAITGAPPAPEATAIVPAPAPPVIEDLELQPALKAGERQWLGIVGSGFRPGATLEFRDLARARSFTGRRPASVRPDRIEYAGRFGRETSAWEVVVRNPDGARSGPMEFDAGEGVMLVLEPRGSAVEQAPTVIALAQPSAEAEAAAAPASAPFRASAEQQQLAGMLRGNPAPEEVYAYLAALEGSYAGDVDFDYPLGVSALDSGRPSDAVLILQRAVASRPAFSGARMELARAYYASGDNESARREFTTLQGEQPPEEAARVIAEYLAAIDQRAAAYQRQRTAFLELGFGYDSNANGGPDIQSFLISGIPVALDSRNQSTGSGYYGATLGGSYNHPFAPGWRLIGQGQAGYRQTPEVPFLNSQLLRAALGLEWAPGRLAVALTPSVTRSALDTEENSLTWALDGGGTYTVSGAAFSLNARYAQVRYAPGLEIQDVDSTALGGGTQTLLPGLPVMAAAAFTAGRDEPVLAGSPFGRDVLGSRLALIADFGRGHAALFSAGVLEADYDGQFLPGQPRDDEQVNATLAYQWSGWKPLGWTLRGQAAWIDNRSTVPLFDYERLDAGVSVRREFR